MFKNLFQKKELVSEYNDSSCITCYNIVTTVPRTESRTSQNCDNCPRVKIVLSRIRVNGHVRL